ncbi:MAG TPA: 4Fe-4S dicluster domain-containing protein [Terriglobales bacterium]|nr:4Fe-4S dicluster domain-containing protein [Terriglobales bacterium]
MSEQHKTYWMSPAQKANGLVQIGAAEEFPGLDAAGGQRVRRRDFLKAVGFSFAAATVVGCSRAPVEKAIPLLVQPEEFVPGEAQYYASTCAGCAAGCGTLVKVRDGRPIKLEGNPEHALSRGGLCATGQGSLLGLYDTQRFRAPQRQGKPTDWATLDREVGEKLAEMQKAGGAVRLLSGTITSPTLRAAIAEFLKPYGGGHVVYDVPSHSAILEAHERTHGARLLPSYDFSKAEVIAGFDADFLGTWLSPVAFTRGYSAGRRLEDARYSYHVHFEPRMTLTGGNADRRYAVAPEDSLAILSYMAERLAARAGERFRSAAGEPAVDRGALDDLCERLWAARGKSLVVSGSTDPDEQMLVNFLNHALGNYGATLSLECPSQQAQGNDADLLALLDELDAGKVQALFVLGANPAFDFPRHAAALAKVPLLVSLAERADETALLARYVAPDHHFLESWGDAEPVAGHLSLQQPAIHPLGETRAALESLARWSGRQDATYDLLRTSWEKQFYPRAKTAAAFQEFWDQALHDGYVEIAAPAPKLKKFDSAAVRAVPAPPRPTGFALALYTGAAMLDGRNAYNPWLHELPDPVTKVTWDNYVSLAPAAAARLGVNEGDVVRIAAEQGSVELPAFVQPGQHERVLAVALGYGSKLSARFAGIGPKWLDFLPSVGDNGLVGTNAAGLVATRGRLGYVSGAAITRTGRTHALASTQTHNTLTVPEKLARFDHEPRPIIQETTLAAYQKDPASGVEEEDARKNALWPEDHETSGPRWGMVIDLSACTGCSGCVIACQAENNIPVVGKDEVRRNREMHWVRIDRYYAEETPGMVEVAYQPLLCQQCGNAPCETVCPVLATVHSADGLNQQVYNRCIGTRYCANNCPYKGRRFNWFDYAHDDVLANLVLNPDVTVRSRGVMEKCTFCVQRIQTARIVARDQGRDVADGEIQTACQQSCPAGAISFGDLNDPNSRVTKKMKDPRRYRLLSELGVEPAVGYLTLVRDREGGEQHG